MKKFTIIVKTQFDFTHRYENAPDKVAFLRSPHRHKFYVEVEIEVFHDDRELEFLMVKEKLEHHLMVATKCLGRSMWQETASCEQMCEGLLNFIIKSYGERDVTVSVFEDNENGGKLRYER